LNLIKKDRSLGRAFIRRLLRGSHYEGPWTNQIAPRHLMQLWEWLLEEFPGDPYERDNGSGNVTISHEVYHFRNGIFKAFTGSGKPEAIEAMVELMERRSNNFWLGDVLAEMRKTVQRQCWVRPSPSSLMQIFAKTEKRLIRTAGELHLLIIESLKRFEEELHGVPPSTELWNESTEGKVSEAKPKDEVNLSNCLKRFFERDLTERGIIASREVQIRRRIGEDAAQLVDLLVQAVPFDENGRPAERVSVVVEVKCAWNADVFVDMEQQLFDRYLKNTEMHFGVYLVAYFSCPAWRWPTEDHRKSSGASSKPIEEVRQNLSTQAAALSTETKRVSAFVLDARL
jgi:hypothetical protein